MAIEFLSLDAPEPHDRQRDRPRNPDEVIHRYPLVGGVSSLQAGGAEHHARDAPGAEMTHVGSVGHTGQR